MNQILTFQLDSISLNAEVAKITAFPEMAQFQKPLRIMDFCGFH